MVKWCVMKRVGCTTLILNTTLYACREAMVSLVRNAWMAVAVIFVVAVSLIILGASVLLMLNADYLTGSLESDVEISVFLQTDLEKDDVIEIGKRIEATSGLIEVEYIPKEKALQQMKESFGNKAEVLNDLEKNPLPDAYRIKVEDVDQIQVLASSFEKIPGVETVRYGQGLLEKLLAVTHWVRLLSMVMMVALGVAAVFLIATTIRMSVLTRRNEIGIMKLLGATNWYIRVPFLVEGVVLGLTGAVLAVVVVNLGYMALLEQLETSVPFITLVSGTEVLTNVLGILLGLGVLIGALGSLISIHRFLKV